LPYVPPHRNGHRFATLPQRRNVYGLGMIDLKLRQTGQCANHKRVERLYGLWNPQIKLRRRKKISVASGSRWLARIARTKCDQWTFRPRSDQTSGVVDDSTRECLATVAEHSIGGMQLTRIMDQVCSQRGRSAVISTGPQ
jgi:putative transposase